jgi:hypothetical protein
MYLTQGLRRAAQIRPRSESTVFRDRRRTRAESAKRVARIAGGLHTLIAGHKCPRSVEFRDTPLPLSGAGKVLKRNPANSFRRQ